MRQMSILGSKITELSLDELLAEIDIAVAEKRREVILNTNVHGILLARQHSWLRRYRNEEARICHCDGVGIVIAARLLGLPLRQRLCVNDFIWPMAEHFARRGHSVYLLGAEPETVERAAKNLARRTPDLRLVGQHHGHFDHNGVENEAVIASINAAKPHILMVGFGMPLQEAWVRANADRLDVRVIMVVGGFFKRLSGLVPFAPAWVTRNGLEWLYLSARDPRRFRQRYLKENPLFLWLVLLQRFGMLRG